MTKRGPRPRPDELKRLTGTFRKDRAHPRKVKDLAGQPVMPEFLEGRAAELWHQRLAAYAARRIAVRGSERVLAHLCCLDAALEATWQRGETPTAAMVTAFRTLASLFYEPPASQYGATEATAAPSPYDEFAEHFLGEPAPSPAWAKLRALHARKQ